MFRFVFLAAVFATPVMAEGLATGDEVRAALSGNTVMGSMAASGAYTEYYAADGTIRSADYTAKWEIKGDTMCFTYGEDPATCWGVRLTGDKVAWVVDGAEEGAGTIIPGNPNAW
jgi:hypothetical protein